MITKTSSVSSNNWASTGLSGFLVNSINEEASSVDVVMDVSNHVKDELEKMLK